MLHRLSRFYTGPNELPSSSPFILSALKPLAERISLTLLFIHSLVTLRCMPMRAGRAREREREMDERMRESSLQQPFHPILLLVS